MNGWILIAVISYLLFAINAVTDKFLLSRSVKSPIVFAFYIAILSPTVLLLAPFGLRLLDPVNLLIALVAGSCYTFALYYFYSAIQQTSISRILPIEGGLVPVFTLFLAAGLLNETLTGNQMAAFIFLVLGAVLISFKQEKGGWYPKAMVNAALAAFLFALSFTLTKYIYNETNFISGMIWTRLGLFVGALGFILPKQNRELIFQAPKSTTSSNKLIFYTAHAAGALAGFLQNYAISIGSVIIVNALQGAQFAFLLGITIALSRFFPKVLSEKITPLILAQKITAIILITCGLVVLTL